MCATARLFTSRAPVGVRPSADIAATDMINDIYHHRERISGCRVVVPVWPRGAAARLAC